ncbi:MAG: hypothetical protein K8T26_06620 [Lentisphaerae bacterium]|nr:hypothetical protein [Lentisphaerota bacterium]
MSVNANASRGGLLIGLDLGTSAIKGVLMDARGQVLAEAGAETRFLHPHPGWVDIDPDAHYANVCRVLRALAAAAPGDVTALAMAAASGNTLLTDDAGTPLTTIISWMDARAQQAPPAVLAGLPAAEVARITGWPCVDCLPLAHLAWMREQRPGLWARVAHAGMDTDWLLHRLTGRWMMDVSTATTFHLVDQVAGVYHAPFLAHLGLRRDQLSPLAPVGVAVGALTASAQNDTGLRKSTTVVTGCFDHPAAARAVGVLAPGQLMLSCGTSWVGFMPCLERQAVLEAQLLCDPFLAPRGGPWGGMFSIPQIGTTIEWYITHVIAPGERDPIRCFNESAAEALPGAGGLEIDLRAAPQPVSGSRANVSRAVMEGAARLLNARLLALKDRGWAYDRAVMVGGPAASPVWPRIVSEITGLGLSVGGRSAGARGAALLAGIGTGMFRDEQDAVKRTGGRS